MFSNNFHDNRQELVDIEFTQILAKIAIFGYFSYFFCVNILTIYVNILTV